MTRFGQLEFDDQRKPAQKEIVENSTTQPASGEPLRDSHYFQKQATMLWLNGDYELALRNFSRAVEHDATFFEGWYGQVQMLIELEEYPEAVMWADKALKLFPDNAELLALKGVAMAYDAKIDDAFAYSDKALEKENAGARVWLGRAKVLMLKRSKIALNCISNAVSVAGPGLATVQLQSGRILLEGGMLHEAIEHLEAAVKLLPKSAMAWFELGSCQSLLGRAEAEVTLKQCLQLRPGWREAQDELNNFPRRRGFFSRLFGR
jgi:tetratricopeptide (TPR) repeat protein